MRTTRRRTQGFTLVEVLVALAVLGIALATILRLGHGNLRLTESRERGADLAVLAETVLDAAVLGVEADLGTPALPMPRGVTWRVERGPFRAADLDGIGPAVGDMAAELERVRVRVEDANGRGFDLAAAVPVAEP